MQQPSPDSDLPPLASVKVRSSPPCSPPPPAPISTNTPTTNAQRKIGIAVDLSDESAFAVEWSVRHYLRHGDAVILIHVRPTSVLYGADWGSVDVSMIEAENGRSQQKLEEDFDAITIKMTSALAHPLVEARIAFKIHIVKDHDMKERLCLEVERLRLSALVMGSWGFGAKKRGNNGRLGSVIDYCVRHCICPVIVVRHPDEKDGDHPAIKVASQVDEDEEEPGSHNASKDQKGEIGQPLGLKPLKRECIEWC